MTYWFIALVCAVGAVWADYPTHHEERDISDRQSISLSIIAIWCIVTAVITSVK